jgi:iron complex outermembrane receptor protein
MPVDFANMHYAAAYSLINGKLGYQARVCSHFNLDVFAGLDNVTNTHYATSIFLNSRDYPKIYNPMPLRNWYLGTSLKFIF